MVDALNQSAATRVGRIALIVFCLVSMVASGRQTLWYFAHGPGSSDFRIFMTGVEMVRSGEGRQLYSFDAQQRTQLRLYPETRKSGLLPFNHLAYELLYYWPISQLSYRASITAWAVINTAIVFLIAWLMAPYTRSLRQRTGIPIAFLLLAFYPVVFTLGEGQDSLIFLLLLTASLRAMDGERPFLSGFVLALACFKLHLALLLAFFVFFLRGKWRGLAGFTVGGTLVGTISLAMVGPRIFSDYPAMLRNQGVMTPWGFAPWYMPNLRGILQWGLARWLDYGAILPIIFIASLVVGVLATWITLRTQAEQEAGLVYSTAILTTALISYHFHMQDLSIAALPMVALLDRAIAHWTQRDKSERVMALFSSTWNIALCLAVASLYLFRVVAIGWPILLIRGCVLSIPLLFLWAVALRFLGSIDSTDGRAKTRHDAKVLAAGAC
jgi:Glycosyltransferase family 87